MNHDEFRRGLEHMGIALNEADFNTVLDLVDKDRGAHPLPPAPWPCPAVI